MTERDINPDGMRWRGVLLEVMSRDELVAVVLQLARSQDAERKQTIERFAFLRPIPSRTHILWPKDRAMSEEGRIEALGELRRSWEEFHPGEAYEAQPCEVGDLVGYRAVPK